MEDGTYISPKGHARDVTNFIQKKKVFFGLLSTVTESDV